MHIDEVRYVVHRWRMDYNHYRPHSSLGYVSPVAFAATCGYSHKGWYIIQGQVNSTNTKTLDNLLPLVQNEDRELTVENSSLSDYFEPYAVHVYKLEGTK